MYRTKSGNSPERAPMHAFQGPRRESTDTNLPTSNKLRSIVTTLLVATVCTPSYSPHQTTVQMDKETDGS